MVTVSKRFQDLHRSDQEVDWVEVHRVERDICLLYHQLADYSYVMGDLYYDSVYNLPYWEYLDLTKLEPETRSFVRTGCLVLLFAMASEVLDCGSGYLTADRKRYEVIKAKVNALDVVDDETRKLVDAVRKSFAAIDAGQDSFDSSGSTGEVNTLSVWIHQRFVHGYFVERANASSVDA